MTFNKGSLILIDYTAKVKDSTEIFDTTIEEDAKKHSIHESNIKYQPKLVSIGEVSYPVLKGLDEALAKTVVGDKLTVEVTPDKRFGARDSLQLAAGGRDSSVVSNRSRPRSLFRDSRSNRKGKCGRSAGQSRPNPIR